MAKWLKLVKNKCRCGSIADCLVVGKTTKKGDKMKVVGAKCNDCGLKIEADENCLKTTNL